MIEHDIMHRYTIIVRVGCSRESINMYDMIYEDWLIGSTPVMNIQLIQTVDHGVYNEVIVLLGYLCSAFYQILLLLKLIKE